MTEERWYVNIRPSTEPWDTPIVITYSWRWVSFHLPVVQERLNWLKRNLTLYEYFNLCKKTYFKSNTTHIIQDHTHTHTQQSLEAYTFTAITISSFDLESLCLLSSQTVRNFDGQNENLLYVQFIGKTRWRCARELFKWNLYFWGWITGARIRCSISSDWGSNLWVLCKKSCQAAVGVSLQHYRLIRSVHYCHKYSVILTSIKYLYWFGNVHYIASLFSLGNVINIQTGQWMGQMSGLGAGLDSFYEYLLKVSS